MQTVPNLGALFINTAERLPKKAAFLRKISGRYEPIFWEDALREIRSIAASYLSMGLRPGDRVAILSENRPEWRWRIWRHSWWGL